MSSFDTWQIPGRDLITFGHNGDDPVTYGLISTEDLDGREFTSSRLAGGFDGGAEVASFAQAKGWVTAIDLTAGDADGFATLRKDLMAATAEGVTGEYTVHRGDDVWTFFAKVAARDIPRNEGTDVRHYGEGAVAFAAVDPVGYGPTDTITFTGTSDSEAIDCPGWVDSYRWKWVVPGPVVNPALSSSLDPTAVVRYVGTIPDGSNLVVELFPRGQVPGYFAKIVADADLDDYAATGIGEAAYGSLDGGPAGSARPPQWFPTPGGEQTITYTASSGTGGSEFTWRPGFA